MTEEEKIMKEELQEEFKQYKFGLKYEQTIFEHKDYYDSNLLEYPNILSTVGLLLH